MHRVNAEMKSCIEECLRCYQTCLSTAMGHCLEIGGQHTEPKHLRRHREIIESSLGFGIAKLRYDVLSRVND